MFNDNKNNCFYEKFEHEKTKPSNNYLDQI